MASAPRRVVVVGAGIVGVCTGLCLARDGHEVVIVDPRAPGRATSFGNAGSIAVNSIWPVSTPGAWMQVPRMLLDPAAPLRIRWPYLPRMAPWLLRFLAAGLPSRVERIAAEIHALNRDAMAAHETLMKEHRISDIVRPTGWLKVYASQAAFDATAAERAALGRNGLAAEELGPDEIRQLEPGLAHHFTRGIFQPANGFVTQPSALTDAYAEAFVRRSGRILPERAVRFEFEGNRPVRLVTDLGIHAADRFVICAGAWSRPLAAMLGSRVPLDTERGYHLNLGLEAGPGLRRPVVVGDHGFVLAPMRDGLRLTSGVEFAGLAAPPDFRRIYRMLALAREALPGLGETVSREWMGFRPSFPDSKPVLGASPHHDNVFFGFGHGHLGLTQSARTGQLIADLVAGRDPGIDLAPYRADRFGGLGA